MHRRGGFTLTELIVTLVILGILAIAIVPRFLDRSTFDSRGFHDETLAILRYAQKTAIAQRRNVCVAFT
ncbi:type II secretion system protein, partial [Noviherbaspirillum sp.]|uniref:pilus assembly FimT family protein n=1 Tax=Noviherbaspirillum sp. TaxID=1926288 RepID=UPI002D701AB9